MSHPLSIRIAAGEDRRNGVGRAFGDRGGVSEPVRTAGELGEGWITRRVDPLIRIHQRGDRELVQ